MAGEEMSAMPVNSNTIQSSLLRRFMAGMEALMLAGVIYLVNADQQRKEDMIILKTTSAITAQSVSGIPEMNVRLVRAESDIAELKRRVSETDDNVRQLDRTGRIK